MHPSASRAYARAGRDSGLMTLPRCGWAVLAFMVASARTNGQQAAGDGNPDPPLVQLLAPIFYDPTPSNAPPPWAAMPAPPMLLPPPVTTPASQGSVLQSLRPTLEAVAATSGVRDGPGVSWYPDQPVR